MKEEDKNKHARDFAVGREDHPTVAEWIEDGIKVMVMAAGQRHFTAYMGIPSDHPLAGFEYDDLSIDCHGGLTFAGEGDGDYRPKGYYWYGWDYAHLGDYSYFDYEGAREKTPDEKDWTLGEIKKDAWHAIYDMARMKKLAEAIHSKAIK